MWINSRYCNLVMLHRSALGNYCLIWDMWPWPLLDLFNGFGFISSGTSHYHVLFPTGMLDCAQIDLAVGCFVRSLMEYFALGSPYPVCHFNSGWGKDIWLGDRWLFDEENLAEHFPPEPNENAFFPHYVTQQPLMHHPLEQIMIQQLWMKVWRRCVLFVAMEVVLKCCVTPKTIHSKWWC
jgi:hypothetical protein